MSHGPVYKTSNSRSHNLPVPHLHLPLSHTYTHTQEASEEEAGLRNEHYLDDERWQADTPPAAGLGRESEAKDFERGLCRKLGHRDIQSYHKGCNASDWL